MVWHSRLGYIDHDCINHLAKEGLLEPLSHIDSSVCEHWFAKKSIRKPFGETTRAQTLLQLIHFDTCGHINARARHGAHYFITFIDDFTHFDVLCLISHGYETLDCFKRF